MSLAVLRSRALNGIDAPPVSVEIHLANGLPAFNIVGLADTEVRESRERVRAALLNSDFEFPNRRITVNLAPADLPKESGRFDLAIALGILAAGGQLPAEGLDAFEFAGELSLAGDLRPVRGALAMAMGLARDNRARMAAGERPRAFIVAMENGPEAALVEDLAVHAGATLREICHHVGLLPEQALGRARPPRRGADAGDAPDMRDVRGQLQARRAMEVAAAGQHSVLLVGPPGTGKSMLAQRFPGLLPPMTESEALDAAAVLSLTPGGFQPSQWGRRPFRSPHHTASGPA
ncbi:MAG: ATP-binding protein, partial [Cupriavidus sp.]|nr:ATP-binding protein [Cupriavidus sp.]